MSDQYVYQPPLRAIDFQSAVSTLRKRVNAPLLEGWVPATEKSVVDLVVADLCAAQIPLSILAVTRDELKEYCVTAEYASRYPDYYTGNLPEKSFEHLVCFRLLELDKGDVFLDVASENSPMPEIARRLYGATAYAQDIMYAPGVNGAQIGGDACAMPVPNGFATKVALTCSLEHFEGDGDTRLLIEMGRVLRSGGRAVVVPLYMFARPAVQTDPLYSASADVHFDNGTTVFCAREWANRHGRFYSAASLLERIIEPARKFFEFMVYQVAEPAALDPSIYSRFVLLATRK